MLICRMHQMIWLPIYGEKGGAETGKTLWDSCPRNPREYYK